VTLLQVLMVLLILAGLVYALMYVGWLPRPHGSASSAGTLADVGNSAGSANPQSSVGQASESDYDRGDGRVVATDRDDDELNAAGSPQSMTLAWGDGTYLSTTIALSRHERVGATGLDTRVKANMVVDDSSVRWEREGLGELRVAGRRLVGVSLKHSLTDMLLGQAKVVAVSWRASNKSVGSTVNRDDGKDDDSDGQHGDLYVTGFLPRSRTDSAALASAMQRLMKMDGTS
jgi:hypothetical protein